MMQTKLRNVLLVVLLVGLFTPQAQAASQDECAIWICLPAGFAVPECGSAYKAMVRRIKKFKPPLPSFMSCAVKSDDNSTMSYDYSYAAWIPGGKKCTQWVDEGESSYCAEYASYEGRYIKGTKCRSKGEGEMDPPGCTGSTRYVDVFIDGEQAGETFYWDRRR